MICLFTNESNWTNVAIAIGTIVMAVGAMASAILLGINLKYLRRQTNTLIEANSLEKQKRKNSIKPYLEHNSYTQGNAPDIWIKLKLVNTGQTAYNIKFECLDNKVKKIEFINDKLPNSGVCELPLRNRLAYQEKESSFEVVFADIDGNEYKQTIHGWNNFQYKINPPEEIKR